MEKDLIATLALLTDEERAEVERLQTSEYVALARKEQRLKYKQKQVLYTLRSLNRRGRELANSGFTIDIFTKAMDELERNASAND